MNDKASQIGLPGIELQHTLHGHREELTAIVWSADGKFIASASKDRTIRIWNVATGQEHSTFINKGRSGAITSIAWSTNGQHIIAGTTTRNLRIWNCKTGKVISKQGHSASIYSVACAPNGKFDASASGDIVIPNK